MYVMLLQIVGEWTDCKPLIGQVNCALIQIQFYYEISQIVDMYALIRGLMYGD